jgi:Ribonuclease G/E
MPAKETLNSRVARPEEAQIRLDNAMAHLAEVQAQDQTEAREREKRVDERIDKLVIAIGESVGRMPPAMTTQISAARRFLRIRGASRMVPGGE